jgi:hypothetical protein
MPPREGSAMIAIICLIAFAAPIGILIAWAAQDVSIPRAKRGA